MILDQLCFTTALPTLNAFYVVTRAASTAARSHPHHPQETNIVEVKAKAGVRPVTISVISFLDDLSAEELEVLRKLLNDAPPWVATWCSVTLLAAIIFKGRHDGNSPPLGRRSTTTKF